MPDPTPPNPDPNPNPNPNPNPAPWHAGVDAEHLGLWQNKGWKVDDPKALATELTKSYQQLERHFGTPPDQLLRMPKPDAKPEDIKAFWARLGAPAEAKDYDFSGIKDAAGQPIAAPLADALRAAALDAHLPKDAAAAIAASVVKHLDDAKAADGAVRTAKIAAEKAQLVKDWGVNFDFNHLKAMEGARRLGITPEAVQNLEKEIGYKATMEAMRKIGAGTSEDIFVDRGAGGQGGPVTTREGAMARKAELFADKAWTTRLNAGDVKAIEEWKSLNVMIDGNE
jgi:hypothetical protein